MYSLSQETNKIKQIQQQIALKHAQALHKDKAFREIEKKRTRMFLNAKEQFLAAAATPSTDTAAKPTFRRKNAWHARSREISDLHRRDCTDVIEWLSPSSRSSADAARPQRAQPATLVDELLEQCWVIIQGRARPDMSRSVQCMCVVFQNVSRCCDLLTQFATDLLSRTTHR